jgi:predicted phosphate transport protein (TIGR00153 family)
MRFRLVPTDDRFFALFTEGAQNMTEAAGLLREFVGDLADGETRNAAIKVCERRGDELTRSILQRLSSTFVTPFDREDIHALAEAIDDVLDEIHAVADLLHLMAVRTPLPEVQEQAQILVQMAEQTVSLMERLESMKGVQPFLDAIDALESEGDGIYRRTVSHLFSGEFDALEVLRWKDIVNAMEQALNTVEDISDVVASIVLKHA